MKNIDELQCIIGFNPTKKELFELALTHPSCNSRMNTKHHDYERLEYMGDSVIGFVTADMIFSLHPTMEPGYMTKLRSNLVKTQALASYARSINLTEYIFTGNSIKSEQLAKNDHILEDVFEALTGAIYLEKGIDYAYGFLKQFLEEKVMNYNEDELTDYKSKLQEEIQADTRETISYKLINQEGPAHDRTFTVAVYIDDISIAVGVGKSKKAAEEEAAKKALEKRSKI